MQALLAGIAMLATAASAQQAFSTAKLDQFLDRLAEKNKGMGSLVLAKNGQAVYWRSFGYAQITASEKKPLSADTRYRISSITKTYTAVMVFQLAEEGKLSLSTTLDRFFPQIPNAPRITIAHILAHRSGIHDIEAGGGWAMQARTPDEVIARIAQGPSDFEPDTQHRYSNAGYNLLGYIVEKAGGKPYQEALKERISSPIGLQDTYLGTGNTDPARHEALSYRFLGEWKEAPELHFSVPGGAGAIVSTPADMAKFIHALFEGKLVKPESLKQMMTMRDGEGMGFESFTFGGKTFYGHTGGSNSSGSWLAYQPEDKLALAYVTNAKIYPVRDIVSGALDIYWGRPFQVPAFEAFQVPVELLDKYTGTYTVPNAPAKARITRQGSTLYFYPPGQSEGAALEATAENKFRIEPAVSFEFDVAKGEMTVTRAGQRRVFRKEP